MFTVYEVMGRGKGRVREDEERKRGRKGGREGGKERGKEGEREGEKEERREGGKEGGRGKEEHLTLAPNSLPVKAKTVVTMLNNAVLKWLFFTLKHLLLST